MTPDPFGYFKPEPFGWTDCAETDEGARPLYDQEAVDALVAEIETERCLSFRNQVAELEKQRDELLAALEKFMDSHEECTDFDGFTAQIVSMDDYHEAQEAIERAKGGSVEDKGIAGFKPWVATHLKTGNEYRVIGEAIDATNAAESRAVVIYRGNGQTFVRCANEFVDKFSAKETR